MSMHYEAEHHGDNTGRRDYRDTGAMPGAAGTYEDARRDMRERSDDATKDRLSREEDHQSMGAYIGDAGVTAKVKMKFLGQSGLDSLDIKVITVNGVVTLLGEVNEASQRALAERAAREVDGVRSVENKLTVKG